MMMTNIKNAIFLRTDLHIRGLYHVCKMLRHFRSTRLRHQTPPKPSIIFHAYL
jgi:hypothetical protein